MSDKRRRRRKNSGEESEEEEADHPSDASDRDYASANEADRSPESASDEAGSEEGGEEEMYPGEERDKEGGEDGDGETEAGGNQDAAAAKTDKAGVDEDRRNPAYIPKRGLFYEHDDRLESGDEAELREGEEDAPDAEGAAADKETKTPSKDAKPRRVYKADAAEKWGHDKFLDLEQAPKTKEELVSAYGYDIRNEDNAPRARRRRRYGRGPNKYTRNWEDEDAYQAKAGRGRGAAPTQRGRGTRPTREGDDADEEEAPDRPASPRATRPRSERGGPRADRPPKSRGDPDERQTRGGAPRGRGGASSARGGAPSEQARARGSESSRGAGGGRAWRGTADAVPEERAESVEARLSKVALGKESAGQRGDAERERPAGPAPHGDGKPKRYSNLRPGRGDPPGEPRQRQFYDYQQRRGGDGLQFANAPFPATPNNGPPPDAPFLAAQTQPAGSPRVAVPPSAAGTASPYIAPASGIMNYGPPPPVAYGGVPVTVPIPLVGVSGAAHHPPADPLAIMAAASHLNQVPAYVATNPVVAVSANDQALLAQVHGGVTYFNPTAQAHVPMRSHVGKRPKAAIPIVDPSEMERRANGEAGSAEATLRAEPALANTTA